MMKKLTLTMAFLSMFTLLTYAQYEDDYDDSSDDSDYGDYNDDYGSEDYDYDENGGGSYTDSTEDDDGYDDYDEYSEEGSDYSSADDYDYVRTARPKFEHKTYERFSGMPYDSATELITYLEIVEVMVPDKYLGEPYDYADSLYARALTWMNNQFGKKQTKKMIEESGMDKEGREGLTITAIAQMPLVVEFNKFAKSASGMLKFNMELRFKDGRYRYKFNNFIHVEEDFTEGKEAEETYLEYYMEAKKNVETNDKILIAANDQVNDLIDDLKETCDAMPFVDDDDW